MFYRIVNQCITVLCWLHLGMITIMFKIWKYKGKKKRNHTMSWLLFLCVEASLTLSSFCHLLFSITHSAEWIFKFSSAQVVTEEIFTICLYIITWEEPQWLTFRNCRKNDFNLSNIHLYWRANSYRAGRYLEGWECSDKFSVCGEFIHTGLGKNTHPTHPPVEFTGARMGVLIAQVNLEVSGYLGWLLRTAEWKLPSKPP